MGRGLETATVAPRGGEPACDTAGAAEDHTIFAPQVPRPAAATTSCANLELYRRKLMAMLDAGLVSLALRGSGLAGSSKKPSTKVQLTTSRTASANGGAARIS